MPVSTRLAHQELLRALAVVVVVVDQAVVRGLEAVELLGLAADGQRREQHFVAALGARRRLFVAGIEHFEVVAGLHLALEIDVEGIHADQFVDQRARDVVAQRGFVDALVERHAGGGGLLAGVLGVLHHLGVDILGIDRDVFAGVGQRGDRDDGDVVGDDHAHRLQTLLPRHRRHQHAQLLAFLDAAVAAVGSERLSERGDLVGVAPSSRSMLATVSPFLAMTIFSLTGLPPVI